MHELARNLEIIQDQIDPNLYVTLLSMINSHDLDGVKNVIEAVIDSDPSNTPLDWFYSILPGQTTQKTLTF